MPFGKRTWLTIRKGLASLIWGKRGYHILKKKGVSQEMFHVERATIMWSESNPQKESLLTQERCMPVRYLVSPLSKSDWGWHKMSLFPSLKRTWSMLWALMRMQWSSRPRSMASTWRDSWSTLEALPMSYPSMPTVYEKNNTRQENGLSTSRICRKNHLSPWGNQPHRSVERRVKATENIRRLYSRLHS